jgi:hypothetical protein
MIMRGVFVGIGLFLGYAVVLPLLSEKSFASGAREGAIAGVIAIMLFAFVAAIRPEESHGSEQKAESDSEG